MQLACLFKEKIMRPFVIVSIILIVMTTLGFVQPELRAVTAQTTWCIMIEKLNYTEWCIN